MPLTLLAQPPANHGAKAEATVQRLLALLDAAPKDILNRTTLHVAVPSPRWETGDDLEYSFY